MHGAICNKTVSCPYSLGADCPTPIAVEATCVGGQWDALRPVSCAPLDAGASCDPVGTWQVDYQVGTAPAQPLMASGFELEITTDADGILLMSARGTIDSTDGCTIMAQWSEVECGDMGNETWCTDIQDQLDLTVSGDQATGTYATQCEGECDWHETCAAAATRTSS